MAVQIETRGQLQDFLDVLRKRAWQVILPASLVIAIGTAFAVIVPKKYLARTQLELRPIGVSVSSKEGPNAPFQVRAPSRVKKVIERLRNPEYLSLPAAEQKEFVDKAREDVKVTLGKGTDLGSNFVTIEYAAVDPVWAQSFLTELRDDWTLDVLERDRNKVEDERMALLEEMTKLAKQYNKEELELSELKREHGISATQPIPGATGQRTEDPEYTRLQAAKSQLADTEVSLAAVLSRIAGLEKSLSATPEKLTKEELKAGRTNEQELQQVELDLLSKQQELEKYRPAHSRYHQIQLDLQELEARREELQRQVTRGELSLVALQNPLRAEIRRSIDEAQLEAGALRAKKAHLEEVIVESERTVDRLQEAYRRVRLQEDSILRLRTALNDAERAYRTKIQLATDLSGPLANPFSIIEDVTIPRRPTEPNPWILIAFSIVAGLALGVGVAVALEYGRNCFRSVYDISRVMVVPVLGSVNTIVTRREARGRLLRRWLVGASTALIIGSLVFVTWAWARSPDLLSPGLRDAIEELRSRLK